jgi:hypothetical protein
MSAMDIVQVAKALPALKGIYDLLKKAEVERTDAMQKASERYDRVFLQNRVVAVEQQLQLLLANEELSEQELAEQLLDEQHQRVVRNIELEAFRESMDERTKMLAYAEAGCIDTSLTIAQKARAERAMRELDPDEIIGLYAMARTVGTEYDSEGRMTYDSVDEVRHEVWRRLENADALVAAGVARVSMLQGVPKVGMPTPHGAFVTRVGEHVLRIMRGYILHRKPMPIRIPGRGPEPTQEDVARAWALVDESGLGGFLKAVHKVPERRFEYSSPRERDGLDSLGALQVYVPDLTLFERATEIASKVDRGRLAAVVKRHPDRFDVLVGAEHRLLRVVVDHLHGLAPRGPHDSWQVREMKLHSLDDVGRGWA